ncbi:unnamed protein product [Discosporangium mesarthrocarpum]
MFNEVSMLCSRGLLVRRRCFAVASRSRGSCFQTTGVSTSRNIRTRCSIQRLTLVALTATASPQAFRVTLPKSESEIFACNKFNFSSARVPGTLLRWRRALLRVARAAVRALLLLMLWSPVAVSGPPILLLRRMRLMPEWLQEVGWNLLVRLIELSGPAFVKGAQWASTRRDMFPRTFCDRLGRLRTFKRHFPGRRPEAALDVEFGPLWRQNFELDEDGPIGSGCIAQVYKGRMLRGPRAGCPVAIKVVNPRVRSGVELDMSLLGLVVDMLELLPRAGWLSLSESVGEFSALMEKQARDEKMELFSIAERKEDVFLSAVKISPPNSRVFLPFTL